MLKAGLPEGAVNFVLLTAAKELIADRLVHRQHEYMNPRLLASQMETLEIPKDALMITNDRPPREIAGEILQRIGA